jgi:hypothetical protein
VDINFLLQHLRDLATGTQQVLIVAAAIGPVFDTRLVSAFMEDMDRSTDDSEGYSDDGAPMSKKTHAWVSGLQNAVMEGMIVTVRNISFIVHIHLFVS